MKPLDGDQILCPPLRKKHFHQSSNLNEKRSKLESNYKQLFHLKSKQHLALPQLSIMQYYLFHKLLSKVMQIQLPNDKVAECMRYCLHRKFHKRPLWHRSQLRDHNQLSAQKRMR